MTIRVSGLDRRTGPVYFAGSFGECFDNPVGAKFSLAIIGTAQCDVLADVSTARGARAVFGFGHREGPCFIQFAHDW